MTIQITKHVDEDEGFEFLVFERECPSCKRGRNSLLVTSRKDKVTVGNYTQSLLRIECICCDYKTVKDFKWKSRV